jgi:pyrroline-5-carboxylate reductase
MATTVTFIGGGNMAGSLIGGMVQSGHPVDAIRVADPDQGQRDNLGSRYGIATFDDNHAAVRDADVVVFAVKPQVFKDVATDLGSSLGDSPALVVSVAAGIQIPRMVEWLGVAPPIVRAMPNTPALLGCGATALYGSESVSGTQRDIAEQILASAGITVWVESEAQIDAVTAVSGSGPAYFFMLMEHMVSAGRKLGLSEAAATRLTLQTALGAARMALESGESPTTLREQVTSPGGTTERALQIFAQGGIEALVESALQGAHDRSVELGSSD